jgi:predicted outer membrane repeat protein
MKRMYRLHPVFLLLGLLMTTRVQADPANLQEMRQVCRSWLDHRVGVQGDWSGSRVPEIAGEQPITQGDEVLGLAFRIAPQGFILVPAAKELCPVWFFSETGSLDFTTENVAADVLRGRLALASAIAAEKTAIADPRQRGLAVVASENNRSRWARMTETSSEWMNEHDKKAGGIGPLLSTTWHQGPPFNMLCPIGRNDTRCVAGCLPIATAQIARYHAYPSEGGTGEADDPWNGDRCDSISSETALLHADFRDAYDWNRMPDTCLPSCGSDADSAVAELCYELGVAGQADYGTNCGTGAYPKWSVLALQEHFGYDDSAEFVYRAQVAGAHEWFTLLRDEINASRPVLYAFTYLSGVNHAVVCDGWRFDAGIEQVSLNLGGGGVTGWFAADDNGMSYPMQDYAIIHLAPPVRLMSVEPNGNGDYANIQNAIDAARNGTVIELLDGVYKGQGNRDLNCRGKRIIIRSRSDDPGLCILDCEGTTANQHRGFVFNHDETVATVIQGITIRNGYVSSSNGAGPTLGGAVLCGSGIGASPRFMDCVFSQNHADEGGAIACSGPAAPLIQTCVFSRNSSDRGGAIACSGAAAPLIETCIFWKNTALEGGAFFQTGAGVARIDSSTFYRNSAPSGSGLYVGPESELLLTQSIVARNHLGGGVYLADGGIARLSCCDLYANDSGDWTGGIANQLNRGGNISANPMFCDAEEGDLGLELTSPCAEATCGRLGARPARCGGLTHYVGAAPQYQYKTIAQALAVAREGGTIILVDSLYAGEGNRDLAIPSHGLTIESAAMDPATCVLDVQGDSTEPHRAFLLPSKHRVTIQGITVRHGWTLSGGAIYAASADSARILNCSFRECIAGGSFTDLGGGAVCVYGDSSRGGRTVIRDCSFEACASGSGGGAVSFSYRDFADTAFVQNCIFNSNTARDRGGALTGSRARIKVSNSIFRTNSAASGGAVMVDAQSRIWVESCTMVGNTATGTGECAYIEETGTEGHFKNCILASDTGQPPMACSSTPGTTITVVCCNLWPLEDADGSGCLSGLRSGNIHEDPQFCAPQTGNYQLRATSPCSPDQSGNQGCGLIGALPTGCGPLPPDAGGTGLSLLRCVPNPFHGKTQIDYVIPAQAAGRTLDISIYDAGGRLVRTLFQAPGSPGTQTAHWNALDDRGRRVGSGVFFCRLRIGGEEATQRLIVLR